MMFLNLLIVEDEEAIREGVREFLSEQGFTVFEACDGVEALEVFNRESVDLILLDIKHIDDEQHKKLTGWTNKNILQLAEYLSDKGQPVWIRHVLVPERSDYDEYLIRLSDFVSKLKNVLKFEILPYHKLGVYKWKNLGIPYKLDHIEPPTQERVDNARRILRTDDYKGFLNA